MFGSHENSGDRPTFPTAVKKPQLFGKKTTTKNLLQPPQEKSIFSCFFFPTSSQNDVLLDFPHVWRVEINTILAGSKPDRVSGAICDVARGVLTFLTSGVFTDMFEKNVGKVSFSLFRTFHHICDETLPDPGRASGF